MTAFADAQELELLVGGVFQRAVASEDLGPRLATTGVVLLVRCTEPDASLVVDLPGRRVRLGTAPDLVPNVTMSSSGLTANLYWQGALNLALALADRRVVVTGAIARLLRHPDLVRRLQADYRADLVRRGRDDLLARPDRSPTAQASYHAS